VADSDIALAGWLLVAGPVIGMAPVAHPALVPVWSMPRQQFVATIGTHRTAWAWLNAGFALATIATTAGLVAFAVALPDGPAAAAVLAAAIGYLVGGVLWCAVLAIRTRTTPLLADRGAATLTSLEVALLDATTTGLFQAFVLITGAALAGLGSILLLAGAAPTAMALLLLLSGIGTIVWLAGTGDVIPAVLYLPTMVLGAALLTGWAP
jgi:hypothetical protein